MGRLTTHVLDTSAGVPGRGIRIELDRLDGQLRRRVSEAETNADGRCDKPLLEGAALVPGTYELIFHAGAYFAGAGHRLPQPPFLDQVIIRFAVASPDQHYHVPLLLAPYGYTTYRGT
jgi:5-hydroxyisourate hydrolase